MATQGIVDGRNHLSKPFRLWANISGSSGTASVLGEEPLVFRVQGLRRLLVFLSCLGVLCDCEAVRVLYAEFRTV